MGRASQSSLESAHGYLLEVLVEEIESHRKGEVISPTTGQARRVPPALLTTLAQLLKTNAVDRPQKDLVSEADDELFEELEAFEAEGNASPFTGKKVKAPASNLKPVKRTAKQRREAVASDAEQRLARLTQAHCCGCKKYVPRENFDKNRSRSNGLQSVCKPCAKLKREECKAKKLAEENKKFIADQSTDNDT
jgi:hypothetical protein